MGGHVQLDSQLNEGSCFTLTVPIQVHSAEEDVLETLAPCSVSQVLDRGVRASKMLFIESIGGAGRANSSEEEIKQAVPECVSRSRREDVMLVDDNPMNIEVLHRLLEVRLGIQAKCAYSGQESINMFSEYFDALNG